MQKSNLSIEQIKSALEHCNNPAGRRHCAKCSYFMGEINCTTRLLNDTIALISYLQAENERLIALNSELSEKGEKVCVAFKKAKTEAYKEFSDKVDEMLKRYAHLHKYADEARNTKEQYTDGTPMEMVSVWEVLSLKKWEMCDYETMNALQDNIENIEKSRLLSEIEKDFMLLRREMVGKNNG